MKNKINLLFPILLIILIVFSCKKTNKPNPSCGCSSDSSSHYATYNNFGGFEYQAWLNYNTDNGLNAWFIGVRVPNSSYGAILKVCNPNLKAIRLLTDTSSRKNPIPIKFAGSLKKLCPNEDQTFGYTLLPETLCAYITIDSLIKN
ncbi:MAG: hypothetical protein H7098_02190 [Oligoflexus sp.]|nr:hypothetical protein [Pseudopedobacter sp.]